MASFPSLFYFILPSLILAFVDYTWDKYDIAIANKFTFVCVARNRSYRFDTLAIQI